VTPRPSVLGRVGAVAGATALVWALGLSSATGARAQVTSTTVATPPQPPAGLSLVSQTTWVPLRHTFTMTLHVDNERLAAEPGASIAISVFQSAISRNGFDTVINNGDLGSTLAVPNPISLSTLEPDARGNVSIVFGLPGSGTQPLLRITRPGVYPVKVQLVNTGVASGSFVTWLVAVDGATPRPIEKKLSVAFVWQAVTDPIVLPDGSDDPRVVAQMAPGGRLDRIANFLAHTTGFRMSLVVGPETAVAWKRLAAHQPTVKQSFDRVRTAALQPTTEVLPAPYVPIDTASLVAAGLGQYLPDEYTTATTALRSAFGENPSASSQSAFVDPAPTTDAAVNELRPMLIDRVGVRDQALVPVIHPFTPAQAFVLDTAGGGVYRAVSTAPFVEDLFNGSDPPALRAERAIASLAEIAYETPSIARGIVIAPPARWTPDLPTMETVVAAMRTLPLVQSATLDDLFSTISNDQQLGTDVHRRLVAAVPPPTPVDADEYQNAASQLAAFRDVVGAKDPAVVAGEASLLTALSTSITPARAHAELAQIEQAVQSFTAGVTADAKRITLTSRRAAVPLSFENALKPARAVTVIVHLESAKLLFPKGADQSVTLRPGSNTVRFTVEARASGTFPMKISVTSPNGRLQFGAPVLVTVRSAVFGGWAVGVTVVALVFLAGWWANHLRRTRRSRRLAAPAASTTAGPTTAGPTTAPT
jgi:hypothetical protein